MPENGPKLTLEELLAAKRAERPSEAFWIRFDRELDYKRRRLLQKQIVDESAFKTLVGRRVSRYAAVACTVGCSAFAVVVALNFSAFDPAAQPAAPMASESSAPAAVAAVAAPIKENGLREFAALAEPYQPRLIVEREVRAEPVAVAARRAPAPAAPRLAQQARPEAIRAFVEAQANLQLASYESDWFNPLAIDAAREPEVNSIIGPDFDEELAMGKYADPVRGYSDSARRARLSASQQESIDAMEEFLRSRGSSSSTQQSLDALTLRF